MSAFLLATSTVAVASLCATVLACMPGLHIYHLFGLLLGLAYALPASSTLPPFFLIPGFFAILAAWSVANSIPAILLAAPDESALHTVVPGQKMLRDGKGHQALLLTAMGSLSGMLALLLVAPLLPRILPPLYQVTRPHLHWILWSLILFILLSEEPRALPPGLPPFKRFWFASQSISVGALVFLLSGLLGLRLFFRSPLPVEHAVLTLMPAFVGLFTLPQLLLNSIAPNRIPPQSQGRSFPPIQPRTLSQGALAGAMGGGAAAFFPFITGAIGGMLAGHVTARRNNQSLLVSQGAAKTMYYTGGMLLLFVPGLHRTQGSGAWMLQGILPSLHPYDYSLALGSAALATAISTLCLAPLAGLVLRLALATGYRCLSAISALLVIAIILVLGGVSGLAVMAVASGLGLLPILYGARRINGIGVILLPMACSLSGITPLVTRILFRA